MGIKTSRSGSVLTIEIQGEGEANLGTPDLLLELNRALLAFESDDTLRAAVLTGGANFYGGADRAARDAVFADMGDMKGRLRHFAYPLDQGVKTYNAAWRRLFRWQCGKPVVAAVSGACFDHGLVLLGVHTDIRVASPDAQFGLPAIRRGDASGEALVSGLDEQMSTVWVNYMVQTAEPIDADTARQAFLVNEIADDPLARAGEIAQGIAALDLETLRAEKASLRQFRLHDQEEALLLARPLVA